MSSTSSTRRPRPRAAKSGESRGDVSGRSGRPFLRFYHSEELRAETLAVLEKLERAEDPTDHHAELATVVKALTDSGLDAYFLEPLRQAKAGFMVERSASLGMTSALKVMAPIVRGILARMDGSQLLTVCAHLRQLMR